MIKNIVGHIITITKHRWVVFKLCCKVGIPWRGLVHDLSKFSPTEFWEGVKYYTGDHSPLIEAKFDKGYSTAFFHHRGKNKHHLDYWMDFSAPEVMPVVPYKYLVETVCDNLSAGIVYYGKEWKRDTQYNYWNNAKQHLVVNPKVDNFLTEAFYQVKEKGIKKAITRKNMKKLYKKYCIDDKTRYEYDIKPGVWKKIKEKEEVKL